VWSVLKLATRAAIWRTTSDPPMVGLPVLLAFAAILAAARIALQLVAAGSRHLFTPYGLNAVIAWIAVELAVAALFVHPAARATALSAMFVLSVIGDAATTAIRLGAALLAAKAPQNAPWIDKALVFGPYLLAVAWWIGAMTCVVGSVEQRSGLRLVGRIAGLWLALFAANAAIPYVPVFLPPDYDARDANWWEVANALYQARNGAKPRADIAQIEKAQSPLLQQELARLAPSHKGETDIYTLAIAGWGEPDVFVKELDGGLEAIASVLPIKSRIVRLVNRVDTVNTVPLANFQNFEAAVHAIGKVMDKDNDVFILFMTSHGERTGFALQLPRGNAELTPQQVAGTLDGEGIKNRVVIISACYSGIFVPPLANDNTIVMTAADAQHTSFGCAPERDWTYFGDAFFRQSMHPGSDFADAFDHARTLIHGWELMDNAPPSNPQGSFGRAVVEKLAPFFATNTGQ
jgi:peptidase C13-like protein